MYALPTSETARVDELVVSINNELVSLGLRKANRTVILRALIYSANKLKTEDLIEGIKYAQTHV